MTVKSLCDVQKARIINHYNTGMQQKDLASAYSTSPRTINRVLTEAGLLTPVAQLKADAYNVMQVLKKYCIEPKDLESLILLNNRVLAYDAVVEYLQDQTRDQVMELFYETMMYKALDAQLASQAVNYQQEESVSADLPF